MLAGGCFWGLEDLFRKIPGVISTTVGYTGGQNPNPNYKDVCTGKTGHAEAIQIEFDPKILGFENLLDYFFKIHDPTSLNRQGNDIGSQYRSAIFYTGEGQNLVAQKAIEKASKNWPKPIQTKLEPFTKFYSAEEYHQKYLQKNPGGYTCHFERKF